MTSRPAISARARLLRPRIACSTMRSAGGPVSFLNVTFSFPLLRIPRRPARTLSIPVTLPGGEALTLSPGGQNVLLKQIVEHFCPHFTPRGLVLYAGDANSKWAGFDETGLTELGVFVDEHGKMPDLVVYLRDKHWLVLLEAASSHGPVDAQRHGELGRLLVDPRHGDAGVNGPHQPPAGRRPRRRSMAQLRGRPWRGPFAGWPGARAQHDRGRRRAIDGRTTRHAGYGQSLRRRELVEEVFGWMKTVSGGRKLRSWAASATAAGWSSPPPPTTWCAWPGTRPLRRRRSAPSAPPGSPQRRPGAGQEATITKPEAASSRPTPLAAAARRFFSSLPGDHRTRCSR